MHKIAEKEFTLEDFSCEHLIDEVEGDEFICSPIGNLRNTIKTLNASRKQYLIAKDKKYWWQMIQLLPSSYNQKRTLMLNYEVLANIYKSRKNHKLDEWREFCKWIESLPYYELITAPSQRSEDMVYACRCKNCESYISWEDMKNDEAFEEYRNDCNHDGICMNLDCWTNEKDFCSHGKRC